MPTYVVTTLNCTLSPQQKAGVAECITAAHSHATGAPAYFAQVIFRSGDAGDHFIGGKPNVDPEIFVLGLIRAGRSSGTKTALIERALQGVAEISRLDAQDIWMYVQDIDAAQMAEFGRILPRPGEENAWRQGLSPHTQERLRQLGVDF